MTNKSLLVLVLRIRTLCLFFQFKISSELREVYQKLASLKRKLTDEDERDEQSSTVENYDTISADMISRLVDQIILLIQERILSLGIIDPRVESPRVSLSSKNLDGGEHLCRVCVNRFGVVMCAPSLLVFYILHTEFSENGFDKRENNRKVVRLFMETLMTENNFFFNEYVALFALLSITFHNL